MIKTPTRSEWDTSRIPDATRLAVLDSGMSFEQISQSVLENARLIRCWLKPYGEPAKGEEDGRQIIFLISVGAERSDALFNAPDGMRGRYWRTPDHGFAATKRLIAGLMPSLLAHAKNHPPHVPENCAPMSTDDIVASLECVSAKVWPRELDDGGRELFRPDKLWVPRWDRNDRNGRWRTSPMTDEWEVKGGIIGVTQVEYIPQRKLRRSCQIHEIGFS